MLNTSLFSLFLITSALTVATPGPGVLMTLTSAIRYGLRTAVYVILGTATGTIVMAAISSTGLGLLIAPLPPLTKPLKGWALSIWFIKRAVKPLHSELYPVE